MYCLLCNFVGSGKDELFNHCVFYHRINPENYFFLRLFRDNENGLICKECIRCQEFLISKAELDKQNFLKYYVDGEEKPTDLKPIDIIKK